MTGVIMKALARKTENMPHEKKRAAYGSAAAVTGILCNIILCVLKGAAGIIFNSVAILADAVNNLSDAGNSVIALIGFFLAEKPGGRGSSLRPREGRVYFVPRRVVRDPLARCVAF